MDKCELCEEEIGLTKFTATVQSSGQCNWKNGISAIFPLFIFGLVILFNFQNVFAAVVPVPDTIVRGTDIVNGPTFTVNGNFGLDDTIDLTVTGTVHLTVDYYMTNAAGVILAPVRLAGLANSNSR
jgi:hypothetical protein